MIGTRDLEQLKALGTGRATPEEVACLYHQAFREFGTQALWSRRRARRRQSPKPS